MDRNREDHMGSKNSMGGAQGSGSKMDGGFSDESEAWVTAEGYFQNGKIIATIPQLENYDPEQLQYSIDVALNGQ